MYRQLRTILTSALIVLVTGSCNNVTFQSPQNDATGKDCEHSICPNNAFHWNEGGFGVCSKPCGGGTQSQTVDCRRTSDNAAVPDSNCTPPRPSNTKTCNVQACTSTYTWNLGDYSNCSKSCGGGVKTRTVICQDQNGNTVVDSNCSQPKPATSLVCNPDACPTVSYSWQVTPGSCSVQCGGGTATDIVVCKKNDGTTVADSFCAGTTKPPTTRTCNPDACPVTYTYSWDAQAYGVCSVSCGPGTQTRSVLCKRNDGVYVAENFCNAATKPATSQACNLGACPTGHPVTQTQIVPPASNTVDVLLVVDDSSSMANDQSKLASRLTQFVNDLDALNIDYQICLTTTDTSYYHGSPIVWQGTGSVVLNRATPNKTAVFQSTVGALGAEWSSDERPIQAVYQMIRDYRGSGCFRAQSTMTVISISDEDERSVGGNQALSFAQYQPLEAEDYPNNLVNYVHSSFDASGFVKPFIWNSIIVMPGDFACEAAQDAEGSPSFPGTMAAQMSNMTGGQIASICAADYATNMTLIKNRIVNSMPGLQLQCTPIDNPIVTFAPPFSTSVSLSGSMLRFTPALPENEQVTAKYTCP